MQYRWTSANNEEGRFHITFPRPLAERNESRAHERKPAGFLRLFQASSLEDGLHEGQHGHTLQQLNLSGEHAKCDIWSETALISAVCRELSPQPFAVQATY